MSPHVPGLVCRRWAHVCRASRPVGEPNTGVHSQPGVWGGQGWKGAAGHLHWLAVHPHVPRTCLPSLQTVLQCPMRPTTAARGWMAPEGSFMCCGCPVVCGRGLCLRNERPASASHTPRQGSPAPRSTPPPLYMLRPCPSYSRRRDRINLGPNFNSVPNVVQPHKTWVW